LKIDNAAITVQLDKLKIHYSNLFNGDKTLGEVGNRLINENVDLFINDVKPAVEQSISKKIITIVNQVFERAPYDSFFTS